jgi:hypothetical protein
MVLLPPYSTFEFILNFDKNSLCYWVTPVSSLYPYKYGGGTMWGYTGESSLKYACPYVVKNNSDGNVFTTTGSSYVVDVSKIKATIDYWGGGPTSGETPPEAKHISFSINRSNKKLGSSIFIQMFPNPFEVLLNYFGFTEINKKYFPTTEAQKKLWWNLFGNNGKILRSVSMYATVGREDYLTKDCTDSSYYSTVDGYRRYSSTSKLSGITSIYNGNLNGLANFTCIQTSSPMYPGKFSFYNANPEAWVIDIPDTMWTGVNEDETITVHIHIGSYLLKTIYLLEQQQAQERGEKFTDASLKVYASIADSNGNPSNEMGITIMLRGDTES